jgi:ABC-2 type transport system ATP-binding protein
MNSTPVLSVRDARKTFGATNALQGLSLELRTGELLGLLGPNGAGKTTLIRSIAGRVALDGGEIELFGRRLQAAEGREALGVVPQEIALYPLLTARENLQVFGRLNGVAGKALDERVHWALDWTALGERVKEPVKTFSGGMKRRLNIACAVMHEPKVLLLDEPTVGVDPQSRERIYEMLDRLRAGGCSMLLTTHQLEEAEARCDRIVIVDHGRIKAEGTLAALVAGTIGQRLEVTLRLDRAPAAGVVGIDGRWSDRELTTHVKDIATELPVLLATLRGDGLTVQDLQVRGPSLQSVFLHLTGKELRE